MKIVHQWKICERKSKNQSSELGKLYLHQCKLKLLINSKQYI